jgi:hypothetical protein
VGDEKRNDDRDDGEYGKFGPENPAFDGCIHWHLLVCRQRPDIAVNEHGKRHEKKENVNARRVRAPFEG